MTDEINRILLGVSGGIAAYKAAELVRLLKKKGMDVKVVMTQSALAFIQPLTLSTLSQSPVYSNLFEQEKIFSCEHIELAKWADAILIAPATANTLAKLAHGLADDLLSTICLASQKPLYLAPSMNQAMWENSITQENLERLKNRGYHILEPTTGEQACGDIGMGRMLSPEMITDHLLQQKQSIRLQKLLFQKHTLILALLCSLFLTKQIFQILDLQPTKYVSLLLKQLYPVSLS